MKEKIKKDQKPISKNDQIKKEIIDNASKNNMLIVVKKGG